MIGASQAARPLDAVVRQGSWGWVYMAGQHLGVKTCGASKDNVLISRSRDKSNILIASDKTKSRLFMNLTTVRASLARLSRVSHEKARHPSLIR